MYRRQPGSGQGVRLDGPAGPDGRQGGPAGARDVRQVLGVHAERIVRAAGPVQLGAAGGDQAAAHGRAARRVRRPRRRTVGRAVREQAPDPGGQGLDEGGQTLRARGLPVLRAAAVPGRGPVVLRGRLQLRVNATA